tara:strand:+ start:29177 stop:30496 length:1320 start_codon:yes stop_codon:yes gene_type:complete
MIFNKYFLLFLHIFLGILFFHYNYLSTYYGLLIIVIGTYYILKKSDLQVYYPVVFSAYIIGLEVFLRMTRASLFWEYGKYSIIYFILLGIIIQNKKTKFYLPALVYFILLIPAILYVPLNTIGEWRQYVAFNLSGPACLTITSIYLYKRKINKLILGQILFFMILPIISISVYNILIMPNLDTYRFLPYSNATTSGGYGPNQVSTIFGLGISCILIIEVLKIELFKRKIIIYTLLAIFLILGLLTFSRGGILASLIAFLIAISYYFLVNQKISHIIVKGLSILVISLATWNMVVNITDGVISQRYGIGEETDSENFFLDLTGRAKIYRIDIEIFFDYFFTGSGLGQAKILREKYGYGKQVTAHTEFSRMLAEHGILGLFSLLIMFLILLKQLLSSKNSNIGYIKIFFGILAILSMSHSAMRLAMSPFIFGFIFPEYKDL